MKRTISIIIICLFVNIAYSQNEKDVFHLIEQAKAAMIKKDYATARRILEGSLVYGIYKDSINFYLKYAEYQKGLDDVEFLYQKKNFEEAKEQFQVLFSEYHSVINEIPLWVQRCDTIISAQKKGRAVTKKLAAEIKSLERCTPMQGFKNGVALMWSSFDMSLYDDMEILSREGYGKNYFNYYMPRKGNNNIYIIVNKKELKVNALFLDNTWIGPYSDDMSLSHYGVTDKNHKKVVYYKTDGNSLMVPYDEGKVFSEGLAAVKKDGKWGYIDKNGKEIIPCQFEKAFPFSEGLAMVMVKKIKVNQYGTIGNELKYIDKKGNIVIDSIRGCQNPIVMGTMKKKNYFFIGLPGNPNFSEGIANGKDYAFDKNGNYFPLPSKTYGTGYYRIGSYSCGMARIEKYEYKSGYQYGYFDNHGKMIIPTIYSDAYKFSENYAWVGISSKKEKTKYGCIDSSGKIVIPFEYDQGYTISHYFQDGGYVFSEGLAGVKKGGKWGFVDYKGNVVIPFEFENIYDFSEGFAWVKKDGKWGLVDRFGTTTFDY